VDWFILLAGEVQELVSICCAVAGKVVALGSCTLVDDNGVDNNTDEVFFGGVAPWRFVVDVSHGRDLYCNFMQLRHFRNSDITFFISKISCAMLFT
jgi:hypothetical protein